MKSKTSLWIKLFVGLFSLALIIWGAGALQANSASWPAVEAQIVSSEVKQPSSSDSFEGVSYDVTYEYLVNNVKYSSSYNNSSEGVPGEKLTVYYDPGDPNTSILSQGEMERWGFFGIIFGLVCLGGMAWDEFKSRTANRQEPVLTLEDSN